MKKTTCVVLSMLMLLQLCACSKISSSSAEGETLKEVSESYSLEDAKNAGYVIITDGDVSSGQDAWAEFVSKTDAKTSASIRMVQYDASDTSSESEGSSARMLIYQIDYDGDTFTESYFEEGTPYQAEYNYLMHYEGAAESDYATYSSYDRYVLVNDDSVTWEEIWQGALSSQSGAFIAHSQVYCDLI